MTVLYENSLYVVSLKDNSSGYVVVNKVTSVIEDETTKFPTAVSMAIGLESATKKLMEKDKNANKDSGVQD